jgi:pimeloyl-ACP methyl ester carboxylesterase
MLCYHDTANIINIFTVSLSLFIAVNNLIFWIEHLKYNRKAKDLFGVDNVTNTYMGTGIRTRIPVKYKRIIFIISGFDSFASDFDLLVDGLPSDVLTICPRAYGWDFRDLHFLRNAKWNEIYVYYEDIFKILYTMTESIDIVAHSNGCNIAVLLASRHKINKLFLLAPNFSNSLPLCFLKFVFLSALEKPLEFLFPILPFVQESAIFCECKRKRAASFMSLDRMPSARWLKRTAVPFRAVVQQWRLQNSASKSGIWQANQVYLVQDERDSVVGPPNKQIELIKQHLFTDGCLHVKIGSNLTHDMIKMGTINMWLREKLMETD